MMQDISLTLDEVYAILNAATVTERKSIAGQRLEALDEQIAQLQHARGLLAGALLPAGASSGAQCHRAGRRPEQRPLDRWPAPVQRPVQAGGTNPL